MIAQDDARDAYDDSSEKTQRAANNIRRFGAIAAEKVAGDGERRGRREGVAADAGEINLAHAHAPAGISDLRAEHRQGPRAKKRQPCERPAPGVAGQQP